MFKSSFPFNKFLNACKGNKKFIVDTIEKYKDNLIENINKKNLLGQTPLIIACQNDQEEIVKILCNNGANVNKYGNFSTKMFIAHTFYERIRQEWRISPLMTACEKGSPEIVKILCNNRADVNHKDMHGRTALMYAVHAVYTDNENKKIIKIINTLNANHADFALTNNGGVHALLYALDQERPDNGDVIELLCRFGNGAGVNEVDLKGNSPLLYAITFDKKKAIPILKDYGADFDKPDRNGLTPLKYAIKINNLVMIQILCNSGASIDLKNEKGETALMFAIKEHQHPISNTEVVKILLKKKPKVDLQDSKGRNALIYAIKYYRIKITKILIPLYNEENILNALEYAKARAKKVYARNNMVSHSEKINEETTFTNRKSFLKIFQKFIETKLSKPSNAQSLLHNVHRRSYTNENTSSLLHGVHRRSYTNENTSSLLHGVHRRSNTNSLLHNVRRRSNTRKNL